MPFTIPHVHPAVAVLLGVLGAIPMVLWRMHETRKPVSLVRIVAPPLGMATGLCMFLAPATHVPWSWALAAFALGAAVLAIPVTRTSKLVKAGDEIMLEPSSAFLVTLLALVVVRLALRSYVEHFLPPMKTAALFFLLAFGMILRWRVGMLLDYRRLRLRME